jgi:hypothetical protein
MPDSRIKLSDSDNPKIDAIIDEVFNDFDHVVVKTIMVERKLRNFNNFLSTKSDTELDSIISLIEDTKRNIAKLKTVGISVKATMNLNISSTGIYPYLLKIDSIDKDKEIIFDCGVINNGDMKISTDFIWTLPKNIKLDIRRLNTDEQDIGAIHYLCTAMSNEFGGLTKSAPMQTVKRFKYNEDRHQIVFDNNSINRLSSYLDIDCSDKLMGIAYPLLLAKIGLGCTGKLEMGDDAYSALICRPSGYLLDDEDGIDYRAIKVLELLKKIISSPVKEPNTGDNIIYTDNFIKDIHELAVRSEILARAYNTRPIFKYEFHYDSEYEPYEKEYKQYLNSSN